MLSNNLKELRKKNKLTLQQLADKLNENYPGTINFNKGKLSKWENGKEEPMLSSIRIVADFYGVKIDDLYSGILEEPEILDIYNELEDNRKDKVLFFAKNQLMEQNNATIKFINNTKVAANPSALCYGDTEIEERNVDEFEKLPIGSEYSIEVLGDSMEPLISNGSKIYFKKQDMIENGEIAIVEVDSNNHELDGISCKKVLFDYDNEKIILHSLNDKYEDRILLADQVKIIGKVLFN